MELQQVIGQQFSVQVQELSGVCAGCLMGISA
jgi:hypothetical protein